MRILLIALHLFCCCLSAYAQQAVDSSFAPQIFRPMYDSGGGPVVMIDRAHNNFHTADERFYPFAELLRHDGCRILSSACPFTADSLNRGNILVIANALAERNAQLDNWNLPTPSAFTEEEIAAVVAWVQEGGALWLVADHMPFPGAAMDLAAQFGFRFNNGFAIALNPVTELGDFFVRTDSSLADHPILNGRDSLERIDTLVSFTGQAFQADTALPLMLFPDGYVTLMPDTAWQFTDSTPHTDIKGWYQGAVRDFGKGRVVVFGEAAMLTAQLAGPDRIPVGMNYPPARQNTQFVLNVARWLARKL